MMGSTSLLGMLIGGGKVGIARLDVAVEFGFAGLGIAAPGWHFLAKPSKH
jgi:hypothetical protein